MDARTLPSSQRREQSPRNKGGDRKTSTCSHGPGGWFFRTREPLLKFRRKVRKTRKGFEWEVGAAASLFWFETSQEGRSPHVPGFDRRRHLPHRNQAALAALAARLRRAGDHAFRELGANRVDDRVDSASLSARRSGAFHYEGAHRQRQRHGARPGDYPKRRRASNDRPR